MKEVTIYCDGSGTTGGKPCGFAAILLCEGKEKEVVGSQENCTNNAAELLAAITGLETLRQPCMVTIHSDSQYVVNGYTLHWAKGWRANGWQRQKMKSGGEHGRSSITWEPVPNAIHWERLLTLCEYHQVTFCHVKGHAGHPLNERCDQLAGKARRAHGKLPEPPPQPTPLAYDAEGNRIL